MADDILKCGLPDRRMFSRTRCDKNQQYPKDTDFIPLKIYTKDMTPHIKSVNVAAQGFRNFSGSHVADNEGQLILNRVGVLNKSLYKDM